MAKQRCLICKARYPVNHFGLLVVHADARGMLCQGSGMLPEVPAGSGKRRVHDDDGSAPPRELDDDLTDL